jgi:hypothetical protein
MNHSKTLTSYIEMYPNALSNLEKHFGPNYETVLNFWSWIDTLSKEQINLIQKTVISHEYNNSVFDAYNEVTNNGPCRLSDYTGSYTLAMVTYEIIGMHVLLENGHNLRYIRSAATL